MIGDRWRDVDAGNKAGCKSILIERDYLERLSTAPNYRVKNLHEAVKIVKGNFNDEL
jgi:D-glycero-D-manno-heptose 1,7-bisphosphate phosphatase